MPVWFSRLALNVRHLDDSGIQCIASLLCAQQQFYLQRRTNTRMNLLTRQIHFIPLSCSHTTYAIHFSSSLATKHAKHNPFTPILPTGQVPITLCFEMASKAIQGRNHLVTGLFKTFKFKSKTCRPSHKSLTLDTSVQILEDLDRITQDGSPSTLNSVQLQVGEQPFCLRPSNS